MKYHPLRYVYDYLEMFVRADIEEGETDWLSSLIRSIQNLIPDRYI